MNIAYITSKFPCPAETFACSDVKALMNLGVKVSVYSLKGKHRENNELVSSRGLSDIPLSHLSFFTFLKGIVSCFYNFNLFFDVFLWVFANEKSSFINKLYAISVIPQSMFIISCLKKKRPEIIHLFWGHYPSVTGYMAKKSGLNCKVTMFLGAYDLEARYDISCKFAALADAVFTHSNCNITRLNDMGVPSSSIRVVHRGCELSQLKKYLSSKKNTGDKVFISGGRLIPEKRFDLVLKSFCSVLERFENSELIVFGDGPSKAELVKLCSKLGIEAKVRFIGFVEHSKLIPYLCQADYFLFFSSKLGERLPNVLKEAMFCECICITSPTPGIEELIDHGENGYIVRSYKDVLELVTLSSERKCSISLAAKRKIENNFDVMKLMREYVSVWKGMIDDV